MVISKNDVIKNLSEILKELSPRELCDLYDDICFQQLKYLGNDVFEEIEEIEDDE